MQLRLCGFVQHVSPLCQAVCGLWMSFLLDSLGNGKGWVGSRRLFFTPSVIPSYLENVSFYGKKVFLLIAYLELARKMYREPATILY